MSEIGGSRGVKPLLRGRGGQTGVRGGGDLLFEMRAADLRLVIAQGHTVGCGLAHGENLILDVVHNLEQI